MVPRIQGDHVRVNPGRLEGHPGGERGQRSRSGIRGQGSGMVGRSGGQLEWGCPQGLWGVDRNIREG